MKINFIKSNDCYEDVNEIVWFPIKVELDKRNIPYISKYKCQSDCINIIDKLNPTYGQGRDITRGICVFIEHGFADKNYVQDIINVNEHYNETILDNCDYFMFAMFCHEKTMLKYNKYSKSNMKTVGSGKVEYLLKKQKEIPEEDNTIAFVPTHNNGAWGKTSSYAILDKYLKPLEHKYNILYSPHPYNNQKIPSVESICRSKVVIADCGSTLYEAMVLNKPIIFPSFLVGNHISRIFKNSLEDKIYKEKIGYHVLNELDLEATIKSAFQNGVLDNQKTFIEEVYPYHTIGNHSKIVVDILEKL